jgi:hypothetical protein
VDVRGGHAYASMRMAPENGDGKVTVADVEGEAGGITGFGFGKYNQKPHSIDK